MEPKLWHAFPTLFQGFFFPYLLWQGHKKTFLSFFGDFLPNDLAASLNRSFSQPAASLFAAVYATEGMISIPLSSVEHQPHCDCKMLDSISAIRVVDTDDCDFQHSSAAFFPIFLVVTNLSPPLPRPILIAVVYKLRWLPCPLS